MNRKLMQSDGFMSYSDLVSEEAALAFARARPFFVEVTLPSPAMSFFASSGSNLTDSDSPMPNSLAASVANAMACSCESANSARVLGIYERGRAGVLDIRHEVAALSEICLWGRSQSDEREAQHVAAQRERLLGVIASGQ